jgi:hypothetical protein
MLKITFGHFSKKPVKLQREGIANNTKQQILFIVLKGDSSHKPTHFATEITHPKKLDSPCFCISEKGCPKLQSYKALPYHKSNKTAEYSILFCHGQTLLATIHSKIKHSFLSSFILHF